MLSQRDRNVIRVYVQFITLTASVAVFLFWHPIGWLWSLIAAAVLYVFGMMAVVKRTKRLQKANFEEDAIALQDRALGMDKEPSKNFLIWPF